LGLNFRVWYTLGCFSLFVFRRRSYLAGGRVSPSGDNPRKDFRILRQQLAQLIHAIGIILAQLDWRGCRSGGSTEFPQRQQGHKESQDGGDAQRYILQNLVDLLPRESGWGCGNVRCGLGKRNHFDGDKVTVLDKTSRTLHDRFDLGIQLVRCQRILSLK